MAWSDNRTNIRRFLRDPDGNIWSDGLLLALWNDVQRLFQEKTSILETYAVVSVPPQYFFSYTHDHEWSVITNDDEDNYQCFRQDQISDYAVSYRWELEQTSGATPTVSDSGYTFSHPWEAFVSGITPNDMVPIPLPDAFTDMNYIAYDKEPLDVISRKSIQRYDATWYYHKGSPFSYYRPDLLSNSLVLYPLPSTVEWGDETSYTDNIVIVYGYMPTDLVNDTDVSVLPEYFLKYIEHGVLARAYATNTDGRIKTLKKYWEQRSEIDFKIISSFISRRRADRAYRLTTKGTGTGLRRKHPRLPDEYPDP